MKKLLLSIFFILISIQFALATPVAIQVESGISGYHKNDGTLNANGTIEFFTSDSYSSYQAVYSDSAKSTLLAQPIFLNDSGIPVDIMGNPITIFADGVYWVKIKDSDGNVVNTYQGLSYIGKIDFGGIYIDVQSAYGTNDSALTKAFNDYNNKGNVTFLFNNSQFTNVTNKTIPSNIKLLFINGASLINSGILNYDGQITLEKKCFISNQGTFNVSGNINFDNGAYLSNTQGTLKLGNINIISQPQYIFRNDVPTGTVLNSRIYPEWFGANQGSNIDSYTGLQNAINFAQANWKEFYIDGFYGTSSPLVLNSRSIPIVGAGFYNSGISALSTMNAVLKFADTETSYAYFKFQDFVINGNGKANYGFYSLFMDHCIFQRLMVNGTLVAGLGISQWCNDILECEISYNTGDGIRIVGDNNNIINIKNTKIFNNSGIGIYLRSGFNQNVEGCTIEANAKCGIFAMAVDSLNIYGNYFEANGGVGLNFVSPSTNIKANIILDGNDFPNYAYAFPVRSCTIANNTLQSSGSEFIHIIALQGGKIECNSTFSNNIHLFSFDAQNSSSANIQSIEINSNMGFMPTYNIYNITNQMAFSFSSINDDHVQKINYFDQKLLFRPYAAIGIGNTISFLREGTNLYNNFLTFKLTSSASSGSSDIYYWNVDLTGYITPGSKMYFGAYIKVDSVSTGVDAYGSIHSLRVGDTDWHWIETEVDVPTSGIVQVGFGRYLGSTTTSTVYVANPILAPIGASRFNFQNFGKSTKDFQMLRNSAPVGGDWLSGDSVWNEAPAEVGTAGSKYITTGWQCTVSGTPGTWLPMRVLTGN